MFSAYGKIDDFRKDIRGFKTKTLEASKQYIIDLESAGKQDRMKWMQEQT